MQVDQETVIAITRPTYLPPDAPDLLPPYQRPACRKLRRFLGRATGASSTPTAPCKDWTGALKTGIPKDCLDRPQEHWRIRDHQSHGVLRNHSGASSASSGTKTPGPQPHEASHQSFAQRSRGRVGSHVRWHLRPPLLRRRFDGHRCPLQCVRNAIAFHSQSVESTRRPRPLAVLLTTGSRKTAL